MVSEKIRSPTVYFLMVILPERGCASVFLQSNTCVCNICKLFGRITGDARSCFPLIFVCAKSANILLRRESLSVLLCLAHCSIEKFGFEVNYFSLKDFFAESCLSLTCSVYKIAVCLSCGLQQTPQKFRHFSEI